MSAKLASFGWLFKGRYGVNQPEENSTGANKASGREEKKETVHQEEITRTKSSDAGHRLQLLDKALRLLAIQVPFFFVWITS